MRQVQYRALPCSAGGIAEGMADICSHLGAPLRIALIDARSLVAAAAF
ncbi:hypothetical protein O59_003931 [Cellvibrio sp. BR]|nr:hypothetical protein O59_003931 [Cellvibrio sp. BR]